MTSVAFARTDTSSLGRWWWTVDRWLFAAFVTLMIVGLFLNLAASPAVAERIKLDSFYFVKRQALYIPVVIMVMVSVSLFSLKDLRRASLVMYGVCIVLLILTLIVGNEIKGARRWIGIGSFALQISEFVKPLLAILCAWMIAEGKNGPSFPGIGSAALFYTIPVILLILQPDMGMALLMTTTFLIQLFLAGLPLFFVALGMGTGVLGLVSAYFFLPHVTARIDRFLSGDSGDKFSDRYQITQSLEAFMNGGLFGQGPGEGIVKKHLPDAHADFIFAVAGEEFGFAFCTVIVLIFAFIVLRVVLKSFQDKNLFVILAGSGLAFQFGLQALINMASTLSLIPTKGMTLPFISYGGSSMVALALCGGMILCLTRRRYRGLEDE